MRLTKTLTVDPGFGGTGWAFWRGDLKPLTGVIKEKKESFNIADRVFKMGNEFSILLELGVNKWDLQKVIIEGTEAFGSAKSEKSIKSGNLFKLSYLVGAYMFACKSYGLEVEIISPQKWKGTMNDQAVALRLDRIAKKYDLTEKFPLHTREAVGIGFSKMRLF